MMVLICFLTVISLSILSSQAHGQNLDSLPQDTAMPYQDEAFACFDPATAQRYVRDFNVDVQSFGGLELCNSQVETKKLLNDFYLIEKGMFKASGQNGEVFIKGFVPAPKYYSWMKSQTYGVERGNDIPYATAYNTGGYFTMQDGWAKLSTLGRVGTVIHEARHTAGYRHIVCRQGPYQDSTVSGCDRDYMYGGSHAVEMEYYARVSVLGENFHPVYKKMARLMAIGRSNIFFNTPVIQKQESILLLNADRTKSYMLHSENGAASWVEREVPQIPGELKATSFGAVIYDGLKAFAIDPYENSGFTDLVVDTYSYFKLLLEKDLNSKDFAEYDIGSKRFVSKITRDHKIANYVFPQGNWGVELQIPFTVKATTASFPGSDAVATPGLFLIAEDNTIAVFQPATSRLQILQNQKWNPENKRHVRFGSATLELKNDGTLVSTAAMEFPESKFADIVKIPLYNGFNVIKNAPETIH